MTLGAINRLLITGVFDLCAPLDTPVFSPSLSERTAQLFPLRIPSEPGRKVFWRFRRVYVSINSYFSSKGNRVNLLQVTN